MYVPSNQGEINFLKDLDNNTYGNIWENGQLRNFDPHSSAETQRATCNAMCNVQRVHAANFKAHVKERQVIAINDPLLLITYHDGGSYCLAATTNCCRLIDKVLRLLASPTIPR